MNHKWKALTFGTILVAACGDDSTPGAGTEGTGTGSDGTPTTASPTSNSGPTNGNETADTGTGSDTSDTAVDTTETSGETDGPAGLEVSVMPSSVAVLEADEMGELTVQCRLSEDGAPIDEPGMFTVTVTPSEGHSETDGVYTFPDTGLFEATCAIDYEGQALQSTRTIAVLNEAIDPAMAHIGAGMSQAVVGMFDVLASHEQADQRLFDAVVALDDAIPLLQSERVAQLADVLREIPGDYPVGAELEAVGIMPNADDDAFGAALDDLDSALVAFEATMSAADPISADEAPLMALEAGMADFQAAVAALDSLQPSAHGLLAQRTRVADLVRDRMQPTLHSTAQYLSQRVHAEAGIALDQQGNVFHHFGLLGLTLGMFNQSHIRVRLVNEWYGDYIAQLDESINNFILEGVLNVAFPPSAEGPVIDFLQASASVGFATPGYPSWIDGHNFNEMDGGFNLVLVFGDSWQGIVDNVIDGCGIEESDSIPEAVEKFRDCVAELEAAVDSIFWYPVSVGPGLFGYDQGLDMGPFPDACGGGLPTATFLLPMTYLGRGPSYFINCI